MLIRLATWLAPLPALLLLVAGLSFDDTDLRESWNAGQVLGGRRHQDGIGAVMDQVVAEGKRVWVIGNSNANTDVDRDDLAEGLGMDPRDVIVLSIPNSNTAHWIAMMRRLETAEARPELILVVSRLQLVLVSTPISETARRSLEALLRPGDEDLRALANPTGQTVAHWMRRREAVRDRVGRELRVALPFALGMSRPAGVLRRAMSDDQVDLDRLGPPPLRPLPSPEESEVSTLGSLAEDLGVRLVVVRPPASPLVNADKADLVPEGYAERTRDLLAEHQASFVDLTDLTMQRHHYKNVDHLDEEGARRLTGAILTLLDPHAGHDALGRASFEHGELVRQRGRLVYPAEVPELEQGTAETQGGAREGVVWTEAPAGIPSDAWTMAVTQLHARCSPVRLQVGEDVLEPGAPCRRLRKGRSCHGPDRVGWIPEREGEWRLFLDPERSCEGAAWLYPDDELRLRWPPGDAIAEATHIRLRGAAHRPRTRLTYTVRRGGTVLAQGRLGNHGELTEIPLGDTTGAPTVVFRSNHYALVTQAELVQQ